MLKTYLEYILPCVKEKKTLVFQLGRSHFSLGKKLKQTKNPNGIAKTKWEVHKWELFGTNDWSLKVSLLESCDKLNLSIAVQLILLTLVRCLTLTNSYQCALEQEQLNVDFWCGEEAYVIERRFHRGKESKDRTWICCTL